MSSSTTSSSGHTAMNSRAMAPVNSPLHRTGAEVRDPEVPGGVEGGADAEIAERGADVPVELNHTIVHARDAEASARWLAELFDLAAPTSYGWFWQLPVANGVTLDFLSTDERFDDQ